VQEFSKFPLCDCVSTTHFVAVFGCYKW